VVSLKKLLCKGKTMSKDKKKEEKKEEKKEDDSTMDIVMGFHCIKGLPLSCEDTTECDSCKALKNV
jgi:hypothetical protein